VPETTLLHSDCDDNICIIFCCQASVKVFYLDVASLSKGKDVSQACRLKKRQDALSLIKHVIHAASRTGMSLSHL